MVSFTQVSALSALLAGSVLQLTGYASPWHARENIVQTARLPGRSQPVE
jgi:hypothetical protein